MSLEKKHLIQLFHVGEFAHIISNLKNKPPEQYDAEEKYYLGVSLIRSDYDLGNAIALLYDAENDGFSSPWLEYWRCRACAKQGAWRPAAQAARDQLKAQPNFVRGVRASDNWNVIIH